MGWLEVCLFLQRVLHTCLDKRQFVQMGPAVMDQGAVAAPHYHRVLWGSSALAPRQG